MRFNFLKISSNELKECSERGWIPGPKEEEKAFRERIDTLNHFYSYPPKGLDLLLTEGDWELARNITQNYFDFAPDWLVAHYSNRGLSFFQGAATWIFEKQGLRIPLIQLRKKFETKKLWRMYRRFEVLSHEAVHAARMQFDEPLFEEIFAYRTSPYFWRRWLGPLFQEPWEAYLFLGLLFIPIAVEVSQFFFLEIGYISLLRFLPLAYFSLLLLRLISLRLILCLAFRKLKHFLKDPKKKWAVSFRLSDREIAQFALWSTAYLKQFIKKKKSLRWRLLKENYFTKKTI